jgi:hypothetical protein
VVAGAAAGTEADGAADALGLLAGADEAAGGGEAEPAGAPVCAAAVPAVPKVTTATHARHHAMHRLLQPISPPAQGAVLESSRASSGPPIALSSGS